MHTCFAERTNIRGKIFFICLSTAAAAAATDVSVSRSTEPVVVVSRRATNCVVKRVEALAKSVQPLETWLLVEDELNFSSENPLSFRIERQPEVPDSWRSFGGRRSGLSKPAFVLWAFLKNASFAWHVEDDALYTGKWSRLLRNENRADIVATRLKALSASGTTWNKRAATRCRISDSTPCARRGVLLHSSWPVMGISQRLIRSLARGLDDGTFRGTHEALIAAACSRTLPGCETASLEEEGHVGVVALGGERLKGRRRPKPREFTLDFLLSIENATVQPHRLYHPVKCQADESVGSAAKKWSLSLT